MYAVCMRQSAQLKKHGKRLTINIYSIVPTVLHIRDYMADTQIPLGEVRNKYYDLIN